MKPKQEIDRLDWRILDCLQQNARMTNTEIGRRAGLSQPAVTARIQRLEETGIIEGYTTRVNAKRVGAEIAAFIRLSTSHAEIARCLREFEAMPEIVESHRITGNDCFQVKVVVRHMAELEAVIDRIAKFGPVTTSVILATHQSKPIGAPRADAAASEAAAPRRSAR